MDITSDEKNATSPVDPLGHPEPATDLEKCSVPAGATPTPSRRSAGHESPRPHSSDQSSAIVAHDADAAREHPGLVRTVTPKADVVKVPRPQRRGLFGRFALLAEVVNPYDYDDRIKWFITFIVAFAAMAAPMGSTIFFRKLDNLYPASCFGSWH